MAITEHTLNDALARLLRKTRMKWIYNGVVSSESTGAIEGAAGKRPDIVIHESNVHPVIIETELMPAQSVEQEAQERLGAKIEKTGQPVMTSLAVCLPKTLRDCAESTLVPALKQAEFEYAVFTGKNRDACARWPSEGWVKGDVKDISIAVQAHSVPKEKIEESAKHLEQGVEQIAYILGTISLTHPGSMRIIAEKLCQQDNPQTRGMAAIILINAFVFHDSLAGQDNGLKHIRSFTSLHNENALTQRNVLEEWRKILKVNYWPIFAISCAILGEMPLSRCRQLLGQLSYVAGKLIEDRSIQEHDLTGKVFQRMISDRKFLAAFYTRPASAALMSSLIFPKGDDLPGGSWEDGANLTSLRIGDFACGTGTLLSGVYKHLGQIYELHGGTAASIHSDMMEHALKGCDILPSAAHIAASLLSMTHPRKVYRKSPVLTMSYGRQGNGKIGLGALDLLKEEAALDPIFGGYSERHDARGNKNIDARMDIPHNTFDAVVMNPPFTRPTNHEGAHAEIPNPMFASFESTEEEQRAMGQAMHRLTNGTCYNGHAGIGSAFVELADCKLKDGGRIGLILPLSMINGSSWEKCRQLFRKDYSDLIVLSVTGRSGGEMSFSADTGMGECMIIACKRKPAHTTPRALFVSLDQAPTSSVISINIAEEILRLRDNGNISKLESGPLGGTDIRLGRGIAGTIIDAPVPEEGGWNIARVADLTLVQSAWQLTRKSAVWLPATAQPLPVPMSVIDKIGATGPTHRNIKTGIGCIGPFKIEEIPQGRVPTYPSMWNHACERERKIAFDAYQEGIPAPGKTMEDVQKIWETASHLHFNMDFQFNAQSTAVQFSPRVSLGGVAWYSVKMETPKYEKIATCWGNCTLGLLTYWYCANRQQVGRGRITKTVLATLPFLDIPALSPKQVAAGVKVFEDCSALDLEPVHKLATDENRHELDRRFLTECLGFDTAIFAPGGPLDLLRQKLAAEPSIRGGKAGADV
ncbi:MAG: hypothetical protein GDA52_09105 [Rhodobacteraceae bacterium]|nr:hypothetical protein [Paracoccaceae bacterium]